MSTNFPTNLDAFTNPVGSSLLNSATVPHAGQHANLNDAMEAVQTKVGIDGSADTNSHDYKITQLEANTSIGLHMIPFMASGIIPASTAGCSALTTIALGAGKPDAHVLYFDSSTAESAHIAFPSPESWDAGTLLFEVLWLHPATTVDFGVAWSLEAVAVSNDDALDVSFGTAVIVSDTGGTTNDHYRTARSAAVTVAGSPVKADTVYLKISRVPSNGADTLAVDAGLLGVRLYFTTAAGTDA